MRYCSVLVGWPALVVALSVTGCATSGDPREGGFANGVAGVIGGGYQKRIDRRTEQHAELVVDQRALLAEADRVERERAEVRAELRRAQQRLAEQQARIAAARRQTASAAAARRRIAAQNAQLRRVQGRFETAGPEAGSAAGAGGVPVEALQREVQAIHRQLDDIDAMIGTLGGTSG